MSKVRWWTVTQWDTAKTVDDYQAAVDTDKIKYIAWGLEHTKSGKPHHQMFLYFKDQKTSGKAAAKCLTKLMNLNVTPHCEPMKGSVTDNEKYCSKESELNKVGKMPAQGKRTDLNELKDRILKGETAEALSREDANLRHWYGRTMEYYEGLRLRDVEREEMTDSFWFWGESGAGKSHFTRAIAKELNKNQRYTRACDGAWWDNYTGQDLVIFDDFRSELPLHIVLKMADKYPFDVPQRCKQPFPFTSKAIIITSSMRPEDAYSNCCENMRQIYRRFRVFEFMSDRTVRRSSQLPTIAQDGYEIAQKCSEGNTEPLSSSLGKHIYEKITAMINVTMTPPPCDGGPNGGR